MSGIKGKERTAKRADHGAGKYIVRSLARVKKRLSLIVQPRRFFFSGVSLSNKFVALDDDITPSHEEATDVIPKVTAHPMNSQDEQETGEERHFMEEKPAVPLFRRI